MTFNDITGMNPGQIRSGLQIPYDPAYGFVWALLNIMKLKEIKDWEPIFDSFKIGFKYMGEYGMGSEWAKIIITNSGEEYCNFGELAFSSLAGNANKFFVSDNTRFIVLEIMIIKVHGHVLPVLIDLKNKTYKIIDSKRILRSRKIWKDGDKLLGRFIEVVYFGSVQFRNDIEIELSIDGMRPIEEFYNLSPNDVVCVIMEWDKNGNLKTEIR
jgi:hypothetical protein